MGKQEWMKSLADQEGHWSSGDDDRQSSELEVEMERMRQIQKI